MTIVIQHRTVSISAHGEDVNHEFHDIPVQPDSIELLTVHDDAIVRVFEVAGEDAIGECSVGELKAWLRGHACDSDIASVADDAVKGVR